VPADDAAGAAAHHGLFRIVCEAMGGRTSLCPVFGSKHSGDRTIMQETLLQREKWLILGVLLGLTIAAWAFTAYQTHLHAGMRMSHIAGPDTPAPIEPGQTHGGMMMPGMAGAEGVMPSASTAVALEAVLFLSMWVAMMIAMMFPSVYPMVLLFARVSKGQSTQTGHTQVPTWMFVAGYLVIWTLMGGLMYLASLGIRWLEGHMAWPRNWASLSSGVVLIGAGVYQCSRWKGVCLTHCRSPLSFILHQWREGASGAFRMGIDHGAYCVGCCWGLMLVMFAMGLMSLVWMGFLTLVIFVEKVTRVGPTLSKVIGGLFILLGIAMLIDPSLTPRLPT
jgi:predicted metal-binding membrane protein